MRSTFRYLTFLVLCFCTRECQSREEECVVTTKYQMSGEEFVLQFFEKGRILRTTDDYVDWPLYDNWWKTKNLDQLTVTVPKANSVQGDSGFAKVSLQDVKSSDTKLTFDYEITTDETLLTDSILIPIPILSCRDLYHEFRDTSKFFLHFSNDDGAEFVAPQGNAFMMVIDGEWQLSIGQHCDVAFKAGELVYIPPLLDIKASRTKGRFLAVKIVWSQKEGTLRSKGVDCRPITLQSVREQSGFSRNTSEAAQINGSVLNTGFFIPPVGLGTASLGPSAYEVVKKALRIGYRLFETSKSYYSTNETLVEAEIGRAMVDAGVPRSDIFHSVRIPIEMVEQGIANLVGESLKNTHSDYIDLVILELPFSSKIELTSFETFEPIWKELMSLKDSGKIRTLGMCNIRDADDLLLIRAKVGESLSVVQNWFDMFREDDEIRNECKKHGIVYMGYGIMGFKRKQRDKTKYNRVFSSPAVIQTARQNDVPRGTILLRWAMEKGVIVTPSSSDDYHLESNFYSRQISLRNDAGATKTDEDENYNEAIYEHQESKDEL